MFKFQNIYFKGITMTLTFSGTLKRDITTAVDQISVKSMERHSFEINRLKSLLSRLEIAHDFEE